jgi:TolC family type I secretion outer membrane protein
MSRAGRLAVIAGTACGLLAATPAFAVTLDEAIALAVAHEPGLQKAQAEADAAKARLGEARAKRLPSVTVTGQTATGRTDFGQFFGFGERDMRPRSAQIELQQPLFAGCALAAGVAQAGAGRRAADEQALKARLDLEARVAEAYGAVLVAQESFHLNDRQLQAASELARQADLRFNAGEAPRSDQAQAQARAAEARAGLAQAQAELARARAHYRALVGEEPGQLAPFGAPPAVPASLDAALAAAEAQSPTLAAARAGEDAARAGVRQAQGGRLPEVAFVAQAGSVRDQFLPGYRADGYTVGVQARWTLFSSGLQGARVAEAQAERRAAAAAAAEARTAVDEGVVSLWNAVAAADASAQAAQQQVDAAAIAETSLGHEVKVSERPLIDLLNAQRETLAARTALARARAAQVVTRYQLRSLLGSG